MLRRICSGFLPLLAGCYGLSAFNVDDIPSDSGVDDTETDTDTDVDTDTDTDTDPPVAAPTITSVEPDWGTTAGGKVVVIAGTALDRNAKVSFAGVDASVQRRTATELEVITPAVAGSGAVDVVVVTDGGTDRLPTGFRYWEDGAGLTGVVGSIELYHYVGSYWSGTPTDFGYAWAAFLEPTTGDYAELNFGRTLDTCTRAYASTGSYTVLDPQASVVSLDKPTSGSILLRPRSDAAYIYEDADMATSDFVSNGRYDLAPITGSAGWPSFDVTGFVQTPPTVNVTNPAISGADAPLLSRTSFALNWTGTSADYVVAMIRRYNASGTLADDISCYLRDDGSHTVPSSAFSGWDIYSQVDVLVGRVKLTNAILPLNDSNVQMAGVYWVYGAGFQY